MNDITKSVPVAQPLSAEDRVKADLAAIFERERIGFRVYSEVCDVLDAARAVPDHREGRSPSNDGWADSGRCARCGDPWPCDAAPEDV